MLIKKKVLAISSFHKLTNISEGIQEFRSKVEASLNKIAHLHQFLAEIEVTLSRTENKKMNQKVKNKIFSVSRSFKACMSLENQL